MQRADEQFDRVNVLEVATASTVAHGGAGRIQFARVVDRDHADGQLNFVDVAVLPPGASIGSHRHGTDEEEYYLVLDGTGTMHRDDEVFTVRAGDLIRNPPGGRHGVSNDGSEDLRLFVFEVEALR